MTDSSGTAVYLYGVARGLDPGALTGLTGVSGTPVRGVTAGDLTALVSTVRLDEYGEKALRANLEDLRWLEATARAHHGVVDRAARTAPTAPVRIATVYRDDDRVAQVLREERERFGRVLDQVAGRSEWGVKAYAHPERLGVYDPDDPASEGDAGEGGAGEGAPGGSAAGGSAASEGGAGRGGAGVGTAYLRRLQQQRRRREDVGRRLAEEAQAVHARLARHAVAARAHRPQDPALSGHPGTPILNMAYLLDDEQVEEFLALVRELDGRTIGVEVEVTGPWPPYSFIEEA